MPKGKAKGRRGAGTTGAERRAGARQRARENIAMKEIAESCDYFREEWRGAGREFRRTCDVCGAVADAADRPFPTCACVSRRYCGEACQAEDWAARHAKTCASGYLYLEG